MKIIRHSALAATICLWLGGSLLFTKVTPDIHEAISQYSTYGSTWVYFGITLTLAALFLALFGIYLRCFWSQAHQTTNLAAICFIITAWSPYGTDLIPFWIHVISFYLAVFFYAFTLWRCTIDIHLRLSHALLFAIIASSLAAGVAVLAKQWSFHIELILIIIAQIWTLMLAYIPTSKDTAASRLSRANPVH